MEPPEGVEEEKLAPGDQNEPEEQDGREQEEEEPVSMGKDPFAAATT